MRVLQVLTLVLILQLLISERVIADANSGAKVVRGELLYVLCAASVHVRAENLHDVLFTSGNFERIRPFQGWGENKKNLAVNGENISFVRVQFADNTNRPNDIGWVAEQFVKLKSDCAGSELPQISIANDSLKNISGLSDTKCCLFPIEHHPEASYTTGARAFGAGRTDETGHYRAHAANDLYTYLYANVRAVAPGTVVVPPYPFYMMTFQVAIVHPGGWVARYGEIASRRNQVVHGIEKGSIVRTGQVIGHAGQTFHKDGTRAGPQPMLHFELYSGRAQGALSTKPGHHVNKYHRRSDLIDPTKYVARWEQMTF